jgi:hypothetical protein
MKTLPLVLLAALAATGCETTKQKEARGMVRTPAGNWVKKGTPYFGDGNSWLAPGQVAAFDGAVFDQAMERNYGNSGPQPVIVVGPDTGTVIATQSSMGTVISQFGGSQPPVGGYRPAYPQPVGYPYGY